MFLILICNIKYIWSNHEMHFFHWVVADISSTFAVMNNNWKVFMNSKEFKQYSTEIQNLWKLKEQISQKWSVHKFLLDWNIVD